MEQQTKLGDDLKMAKKELEKVQKLFLQQSTETFKKEENQISLATRQQINEDNMQKKVKFLKQLAELEKEKSKELEELKEEWRLEN